MIKRLSELVPTERRWLAKAVVAIILADGIVEDQQIKFMKRLFRQLLGEEPQDTITEIKNLLRKKEIPELEKLQVGNLDRLIFILDVLTASVFANGKKLKSEVDKYFEVGRKLGLEVGTLSYRLSLEAERERVKRKLTEMKGEIGEFLRIA